jgi:hypothetical protein
MSGFAICMPCFYMHEFERKYFSAPCQKGRLVMKSGEGGMLRGEIDQLALQFAKCWGVFIPPPYEGGG